MLTPPVDAILETALYVDDLDRAGAFYEQVMGLPVLHAEDRMRAYSVNGRSVLLLFLRGGTTEPVQTKSGLIPAHDAQGQIHIAFAISPAQLEAWRAHLVKNAVPIEGTSDWQRGGHSLYFRDPDGNMLEVATTPGLWEGF
ncbi:VOC family protein [Pseudotabrizicola algicola]|uniref:Glyoxalase n=1 Tax=Pseudotabrizicola algicola TaxID=2709381 RepID=A0A6B3RMR4_9RHOB|nr:VOC family protein [Pseudotabrizicola algicola]NEX46473.1 glyoxalase [Pseudotabrizicola algicola]